VGGHLDAVDLLIGNGAKFPQGRYGYNPLPDAAKRGYTGIVGRLLAAGYDIDGWHDYDTAIGHAIKNGQYETFRYLLDNGAKLNRDNGLYSYSPRLSQAAAGGNPDIVEALLDYHKDDPNKEAYIADAIRSASNGGQTGMADWLLARSKGRLDVQILLQDAIDLNQVASVGFWLARGARADTLYRDEYPSHWFPYQPEPLAERAAARGYTDVVKMLVENGASPDILGTAAAWGDTEMLRFLIGHGAKPSAADLYSAAANQNPGNVRLLLSRGLDADGYRDGMRRTPLLSAVEYEYNEIDGLYGFRTVDSLVYEVARALVGAGADVNARDYEGMTPLMFAVGNNFTSTVRLLLDNGARRDAMNNFGDHVQYFATPFAPEAFTDSVLLDLLKIEYTSGEIHDWEAWMERHPPRVKRKSQYTKDSELFEAVGRQDLAAIEAAIEAGGNPVVFDTPGQEAYSVLGRALGEGAPVAVYRLLVAGGAPVDAANSSGTTSLMRAAMAGDVAAAEFFISRGADVNRVNDYGNTALVFAAKNGCLDMIRLLVSRGADIDRPGNGGTPLQFAGMYEHPEAAELLLSLGAKPEELENEGGM
jgi:ankyrin repeat protein